MKKIIVILCLLFLCGCDKQMQDLSNMNIEEVKSYAETNNLNLNLTYEYSEVEKDKVISQSILKGEKLENDANLDVIISKGIEDKYKLSLVMAGDVLIHSAVYTDAKKNDIYDFTNMVSLVKPLIKDYDLAFYNQETILGGIEIGLSTYPRFNSPYEVGDAMRDMGFNLVSLANNHTLDRGEGAIINSTNYWKKYEDILVAGSYQSKEDRDEVQIKEKNGITYTLLSYTTATNGLKTPVGKDYLVNIYDAELVKKDIEKVRDKVDVVLVSMHWGSEYTHTPTYEETTIAKYLSQLGVDIVIGHHPHVIQPITYIGDTLVIYSLGNFLSGQVGEAKNIGMLASVDITKVENKDGISLKVDNIGTELVYTNYVGYEKNGSWYCSNYKLYPFKDLDSNILSNYLGIRDKYNAIIKEYDNTIKVNMFDEKLSKVGE